jgi:hypothetical protein
VKETLNSLIGVYRASIFFNYPRDVTHYALPKPIEKKGASKRPHHVINKIYLHSSELELGVSLQAPYKACTY